ncbi:hypothetical protein QQF98_05220 [Melissococcus plutonius]|uniref:hypothetical protein n=1 Tax=Melissococcus plutonius TaxID=33970 RepID=UPI003EE7ADE8
MMKSTFLKGFSMGAGVGTLLCTLYLFVKLNMFQLPMGSGITNYLLMGNFFLGLILFIKGV